MITNENYEGYLMRYADGELSAAEATEVETFLDEHPELREELEEITAPSLRVTAPVATMPDKERLLHKETSIVSILRYKKWMSIAAAIALFVIAAGVVRTLLQQSNRQPVIAHIDTIKTMAADTLLPDSLYARPEKREPVYFAKAESKSLTPSATQTGEHQFGQEVTKYKEDLIPIIEDEAISDEWIAENSVVPPAKKARLVGGRVIVVETDQLVDVVQMRNPSTTHPDVSRGYIVENSFLATEEKKGFVGRTLDLIAASLQRRTQRPDTTLAYYE